MSCTPVTPAMLELLETLAGWPDVDIDQLHTGPEWAQARAWGWIMTSGELTGSGWRHLNPQPRGIVAD